MNNDRALTQTIFIFYKIIKKVIMVIFLVTLNANDGSCAGKVYAQAHEELGSNIAETVEMPKSPVLNPQLVSDKLIKELETEDILKLSESPEDLDWINSLFLSV